MESPCVWSRDELSAATLYTQQVYIYTVSSEAKGFNYQLLTYAARSVCLKVDDQVDGISIYSMSSVYFYIYIYRYICVFTIVVLNCDTQVSDITVIL